MHTGVHGLDRSIRICFILAWVWICIKNIKKSRKKEVKVIEKSDSAQPGPALLTNGLGPEMLQPGPAHSKMGWNWTCLGLDQPGPWTPLIIYSQNIVILWLQVHEALELLLKSPVSRVFGLIYRGLKSSLGGRIWAQFVWQDVVSLFMSLGPGLTRICSRDKNKTTRAGSWYRSEK